MSDVLKQGDSGFLVMALQKQLTAQGFTCAADGLYGAKTVAAVESFQASRGLVVDGQVGDLTREALASTAKPMAPQEPVVTAPGALVFESSGVLKGVPYVPLHPARTGGALKELRTIVVHTTDTPGSFDRKGGSMGAILKKWHEQPADGAGANFMIGANPPLRDRQPDMSGNNYPASGLVQMASILLNANHAGGSRKVNNQWLPYHGNFMVDGVKLHPNEYSVGIEIENAGRVIRSAGVWYHPDSGRSYADADVFVDALGHGWVKLTPYQVTTLCALIDAIRPYLKPWPAGTSLAPNGDWTKNGSPHAAIQDTSKPWLVCHYTLDPNNKTDAGPEVMQLLHERYGI